MFGSGTGVDGYGGDVVSEEKKGPSIAKMRAGVNVGGSCVFF